MTYLASQSFNVKRDCVDRMTSYRTDRTELTEKLLQQKKAATIPYRSEINLYASYHAVHDETTI